MARRGGLDAAPARGPPPRGWPPTPTRARSARARAHAGRGTPGGGAQDKAVDGMHAERAFIFACFGVGLINTLLALMSAGGS